MEEIGQVPVVRLGGLPRHLGRLDGARRGTRRAWAAPRTEETCPARMIRTT
ncbi:hypothetical protein H4K36_16340 [Streptomyces sp. DHE7-1]|nr:hypothetical protein [Streptomyces sp. DHE7-1]